MAKEKHRYSLRNRLICYNLTLMVFALVLCGVIFIVSVGVLVGGYVQSDIDFMLTATADSMESQFSYCSDTVTKVRKSEKLMEYLYHGKQKLLSEEEERTLKKEFEKQISISSQNIPGTGVAPFVEKVYLFDREGGFIQSTYYAMTDTQIEKANHAFVSIYEQYRMELLKGKDYGYFSFDDKSFCLVFPILDDHMEQVGSIFYQIEKSALEYVMTDVIKYEGAFWYLCDQDGTKVLGNISGNEPIEDVDFQICSRSVGMNLEFYEGIPKNQFFLLLYDSIRVYVVAIAVIAVVSSVALLFLIYRMTRPITDVTEKLREVRSGKFDTKLPSYDSAEFYEISTVFNEMTAYIEHLIKQVYEKQISIKDMEMKFLQTQMNPHFMFNVLNTIALQAQLDGNQEVYHMIHSFSRLIQAKIYRKKSEKVKICQELEYVNYYLYLQSYRYGDRLKYEIHIQDKKLTECYIPKLCIQLIVENAVVHGIEPQIEKGFVKVTIYEKDEQICIDTEDNGVGFGCDGEILLPLKQKDDNEAHNHIGLNNAHQLIRLMYGEEYGIFVYSKQGSGSKVCIRIPVDHEEEGKTKNDV